MGFTESDLPVTPAEPTLNGDLANIANPAEEGGPASDGSPPSSAETSAPPQRRPTAPPSSARERARGRTIAAVVAASLLSALLASAGTFVAFEASLPRSTAAPAATASTATLASVANQTDAVVAATAKASPSVVTIITESTQRGSGFFGPQQVSQTAVGSGIIFDSRGWVLTNRHVVDGADSVTVQLADGSQLAAKVYGISSTTDLAVVKVDANGWPAATVGDSDALLIGQAVIAIGSPLGDFTNSVTTGIVSALKRSIDVQSEHLDGLIQTDAPLSPGNSGGPLLDLAGRVIGVNTATTTTAQGIGFAIPIAVARPIMDAALAGTPIN